MGFFDAITSFFEPIVTIFSSVAETVATVAAPVVEAASVAFAAAGEVFSQGFSGFADATGSLVSNIFGPGLLTDTLSGALTGAGFSALAGGTVSALTGGDFIEGAKTGGLVGGAVGAAGGFLNSQFSLTNPTPTSGIEANTALAGGEAAPVGTGSGLPVGATDPSDLGAGQISSTAATPGGAPAVGATASAQVATKRPGLLGFWDEIKNSELAGSVVGGVIQGVGGALTAEADHEDAIERDRLRQERQFDLVGQNQQRLFGGSTGGLLRRGQGTPAAQPARPTPTERFGSGTLGPSFRFDANLGRVVSG